MLDPDADETRTGMDAERRAYLRADEGTRAGDQSGKLRFKVGSKLRNAAVGNGHVVCISFLA